MKEFKTLIDQRNHLIESKNIIEDDKIISVLEERTYVSIINSFKNFFVIEKDNNKHIYHDRVNIDEYISLAKLDDEISNKLHLLIGYFEKRLKNSLAFEYSKYFSEEGDRNCITYIDLFTNLLDNQDDVEILNKLGLKDLLKKYKLKISRELSNVSDTELEYRIRLIKNIIEIGKGKQRGKQEIVRHYQDKSHFVPLWLIVHELTMGEILELIEMLNVDIRSRIYYNFHGNLKRYDVNRFFNNAQHIKDVRNIISHHEPLLPSLKRKNFGTIKKVVEILKENYRKSIIKDGEEIDLNKFEITEYNEVFIDKLKSLKEIL